MPELKGSLHYKHSNIEPVDYIKANNLDFFEGNVIKYITRYKWSKTPLVDLAKAFHYLEMVHRNLEESLDDIAQTESMAPNTENGGTTSS